MIRLCTLKPRQICKPAIEVGQHFSLEKAFVIQENGGIYDCKAYQINKEKIFDLLCLQAVNLTPKNGPPTFGNSLFDRCRQVRKLIVFTTKYAVPRQLKDRILELNIRKRQQL